MIKDLEFFEIAIAKIMLFVRKNVFENRFD